MNNLCELVILIKLATCFGSILKWNLTTGSSLYERFFLIWQNLYYLVSMFMVKYSTYIRHFFLEDCSRRVRFMYQRMKST